MNELIQHIERLLQEHDCVTIPDFGAFVLQHRPAEIHGDKLFPPRSIITFNPSLTHDDGLLTNAYARKQQTTYRDARRLLAADTKELKKQLTTNKFLPLCRMGEMHTEGERWIFVPSACTFLPQNLGLSALPLPHRENPHLVIRIRRDYLHYAAACVLGLCLLAISPVSQKNDYADYAALNPINYAEIILNRHKTETPIEETLAPLPRGHYHIVIASLDMQSAQAFANRLLAEGHQDATVLPYKKNLHRVVLASYNTKKEALRAMEQLRQQNAYKRAWVYCEPS